MVLEANNAGKELETSQSCSKIHASDSHPIGNLLDQRPCASECRRSDVLSAIVVDNDSDSLHEMSTTGSSGPDWVTHEVECDHDGLAGQ